MGIFFTPGEKKTRPGIYQRYENAGGIQAAGAVNGIAACVIRSDWGPLGEVMTVESPEAAKHLYGNASTSTVHVAEELFAGGARVVRIIRAGSSGTKGAVTLKDTTSPTAADCVTVTAKYDGTRAFSYTNKVCASDDGQKEFTIYDGTKVVEKISYAVSADGEVDALVAKGAASEYFTFTKTTDYAGTGVVAVVSTKTDISAGTDPTVDNDAYSSAFVALEPYRWNTVCVDTDDTDVHALLVAYMQRVYQAGKMGFAVIGEPTSVAFATRLSHAAAYNSYNVVYVGSGYVNTSGATIEGYKAVARIAGMVASVPSNQSLTHRPITGAAAVKEVLTNAQYENAINNGMLTFSTSSSGVVWVESGVTTLVTPSGDDDEGWKKIKRAKIRFELMLRASDTTEPLVGNCDNNTDGRATVIQALQKLLNTMVAERKLLVGATVYEDPSNPPEGDSAWFVFATDDVDSLEKVYLKYNFRFSPNV